MPGELRLQVSIKDTEDSRRNSVFRENAFGRRERNIERKKENEGAKEREEERVKERKREKEREKEGCIHISG